MLDFLVGSKYIIMILNVITKHEHVRTLTKCSYFHFYVALLQVRRRTMAKINVCAHYVLAAVR